MVQWLILLISLKLEFCVGKFNSPFRTWAIVIQEIHRKECFNKREQETRMEKSGLLKGDERDILLFYFDVTRRPLLSVLMEVKRFRKPKDC